MTLTKKTFNVNSTLLTNLIFSFFPISFIFGNFITNFNILLFCGFGIYELRKKILKIKLNFYLKTIFFLFFWIFFTTAVSFIKTLYFEGYDQENLTSLIKSIVFFRFLLMLLIIYFLSEFEIINFKYFFLVASLSAFIVSLDIIYQYFTGFNILGFENKININSGFFREELIAGGFIQDFGFFAIFLLSFLFKDNNKYRYPLVTITICVLGMGILLSGNRMPLILFLLGLILIFLFHSGLRKIVLLSLICLFFLFKLTISSNDTLKGKYSSIYNNIIIGEVAPRIATIIPPEVLKKFPALENYVQHAKEINRYAFFHKKEERSQNKSIESEETKDQEVPKVIYGTSPNRQLIFTAIDTWSRNKIFGNGLRSFRINCKDDLEYIAKETTNFSKNQRRCSNHPHNYYIEVLTETGLVGLFLILTIGLLFVVFIFKNFTFLVGNNLENFLVLSAVISLILEFFPIQSTGSIFTTNDTTYIILIASIILINNKIIIRKIYNKYV